MKLYTFIAEFRGGIYINQIKAQDLRSAIIAWGPSLNEKEIEHLGVRGKEEIADKLAKNIDEVPLSGLINAWFFCVRIKAGFITVNVVKTDQVEDDASSSI
jgi:hypothetical protein